jgi:predicted nucleic acid-binding protein
VGDDRAAARASTVSTRGRRVRLARWPSVAVLVHRWSSAAVAHIPCEPTPLDGRGPAQGGTVHRRLRCERRSLPRARIDDGVLDRAFEVQGLLADRGQHRLPIPDLVIAAAAESAGLTVLHYDTDFERIADITGQAQDWVVGRGTV